MVEDLNGSTGILNKSIPLESRRRNCDCGTLHPKHVRELLLGQCQAQSLMTARCGIQKNAAQPSFDTVNGGTGNELPGFHQKRFNIFVNGDPQIRGLIEKLTIIRGSNLPNLPANLDSSASVAKAAATRLEGTERPFAPDHSSANALAVDIFCRHTDQGTFGKPNPFDLRSGLLKNLAPLEVNQLEALAGLENDRRFDLGQNPVLRCK